MRKVKEMKRQTRPLCMVADRYQSINNKKRKKREVESANTSPFISGRRHWFSTVSNPREHFIGMHTVVTRIKTTVSIAIFTQENGKRNRGRVR